MFGKVVESRVLRLLVERVCLLREHLHELKKGPVSSSNFGPVCSKSLSFGGENRPFLSSCKRPLNTGKTSWFFSHTKNSFRYLFALEQMAIKGHFLSLRFSLSLGNKSYDDVQLREF